MSKFNHTIEYVMKYGGRCRDCADENGTCPHDGTPCDPQIMKSAIKHTLEALEYGVSKGFIKTPYPHPTPTPCDELETVAYYRVNRTHLTHIPHKGYDELVTRQNAEEVIAAERAEKEKLEAAWLEAEGIISDLKADNAAKDARITELETQLAKFRNQKPVGSYEIVGGQVISTTDYFLDGLPYPDGDLELYACPVDNAEMLIALEADNKRLREALENLVERFSYYADLARDGVPNIEDWAYTEGSSDIAKARAALGEVKP